MRSHNVQLRLDMQAEHLSHFFSFRQVTFHGALATEKDKSMYTVLRDQENQGQMP